jgi:hypothetical protein
VPYVRRFIARQGSPRSSLTTVEKCHSQALSTSFGNVLEPSIRWKRTQVETVKKNLKRAYETYAKHYNLRARPQINYNVGSTVWRKNRQQSKKIDKYTSKLAPRYLKGTVTAVKGPNTYEITDDRGKRAGVFHANDLKR